MNIGNTFGPVPEALLSELTVQGHGVAPLALIALRMYIAGTASPVYELITDYQEAHRLLYFIISERVSVVTVDILGALTRFQATYCSAYTFPADMPSTGTITCIPRRAAPLAV